MARAMQVIDYTKMELGRVTRTWKGRNVCSIARCPKCGKRGERSASIPEAKDATVRSGRPYVSVNHLTNVTPNPRGLQEFFGATMRHVVDHCTITLDKTNVDDLLNVEERKRYDEWRSALLAWVETY